MGSLSNLNIAKGSKDLTDKTSLPILCDYSLN